MAISGAVCSCAVNTRSRSIDSDAKAVAFASSVTVAEGAVTEAKAATWQKKWQMK